MSDAIYINTTTETNEVTINTVSQNNQIGISSLGGIATWGTIFGVLSSQPDLWSALSALSAREPNPLPQWGTIYGILSSQPDLWSELSAKALQSNLVKLSGETNSLKAFVNSLSSDWSQLGYQTLHWNPRYSEITIAPNGNTISIASLSSLLISPQIDSLFKSLSSRTFVATNTLTAHGDVNVKGNIKGFANATFQSLSSETSTITDTLTTLGDAYIKGTLRSQNDAIFKNLSSQTFVATDTLTAHGDVLIEGTVNVQTEILSGSIPLHDLFITTEEESQTLSYNIPEETLSIDRGNTVSLSSLSYRNIEDPLSMLQTIEQFAYSYSGDIHPGYNVTLYNGRVYTFAGTDKNNPNHYLEVNTNPYKPIYREVPLSGNEVILDSFYLGDFKSAKYTLQIETNFNNEIYYSEANAVGSVQTETGVVCEYGQIYTEQLILGYAANVTLNTFNLIMYYGTDLDPTHKIIVKGHRTNFYKI